MIIKQELRSRVPILFSVYTAYLVLFAFTPFTPTIDSSVQPIALYESNFDGFSEIFNVSAWDIWTNILVFVPFGLLFVALPEISLRSWRLKVLLVSISAGLLSFGLESGQLLLPRHPGLVDIGCNVLGAVVGGLLGTFARSPDPRQTRRWSNTLQTPTGSAGVLICYLLVLFAMFSLPLPLSLSFRNWDPDFRLQLGNEGSLDRPWRGEIYLVALYNRMLSAQEVWTNFKAGPSLRAAEKRVEKGLLLFYDFSERAGEIVHDRTGFGPPVDLRIHDPARIQWLMPNGLALRDATVIASTDPPMKLSAGRFSTASELSVEAWVAPADLFQGGPARIITYSKDPNQQNFTLGQQKSEIAFRLRTPVSGLNGTNPELRTADQPLGLAIQHLMVTYGNGIETLYLNGTEHGRATLRVKIAFIDALVDRIGRPFKWLLWSVFIFPLGILSYLFHTKRQPSKRAVWVALATALAGLTLIAGVRFMILKAPVEPFVVLVSAATVLISMAVAPGFNTIQKTITTP